jgi:hypothetical protein
MPVPCTPPYSAIDTDIRKVEKDILAMLKEVMG